MNVTDYVMDNVGTSDKEIINSIINSRFIIDYGTIIANNNDGTVNVQHAVPITPKYPNVKNPTTNPTVSNKVEILYLSGAMFSTNFQPQVGDPVLLVGLKDYLQDSNSINGQPLTVFHHYNQNTLKAIPLAGPNLNAMIQINVVNGLLQIKAMPSGMTLYQVISDLINAVLTLQTQGPPPYHAQISPVTTQLLNTDLAELKKVLSL